MVNSNRSAGIPDFLCIGAQKAGTSWLAYHLGQHPQIWTPPLKELNYFDIPHRRPIIIHRKKNSPRGNRVKFARRLLRRHPLWVLRYLLLPRSDRWYQSLFSPTTDQICGETTPTYAQLSSSNIARVKALVPDVRLIYIIRNPVDQLWSQVKMWTEKHRPTAIDALSPAEIIEILQLRWGAFRRNVDYVGNLTAWQQHFPSDQIFVAYFDDLQANPVKFLGEILSHLDLPMSDAIDPVELAIPRNARPSGPMPDQVRRWLTEQWYEDMVTLNDSIGHRHTTSWLQQAQAYLNTTA